MIDDEDAINEVPDTPLVTRGTPVDEEDPNEFLFGDGEIGDDVIPKAYEDEDND